MNPRKIKYVCSSIVIGAILYSCSGENVSDIPCEEGENNFPITGIASVESGVLMETLLGESVNNGAAALSFTPYPDDRAIAISEFAIRVTLGTETGGSVVGWYPRIISTAMASTCFRGPIKVLNKLMDLSIEPPSNLIQIYEQDYYPDSGNYGFIDPMSDLGVSEYLSGSENVSSVFIVDLRDAGISIETTEITVSIELESGEQFVSSSGYFELIQ